MKKIYWFLFAFLCIAIGLYPIVYFLLDLEFMASEQIGILFTKTPELLAKTTYIIGFYTHITLGGLALLIGWIQFNEKIRLKRKGLHKNIGIVYIISVWISSISSIYIGLYATGGLVSQIGFISLGIVWFFTTLMAMIFIKKNDFIQHQKFMTYSYAATFAAVTLRLWLPILMSSFGDFFIAYKLVAWLCWVPNIIVAFFLVKRIKP